MSVYSFEMLNYSDVCSYPQVFYNPDTDEYYFDDVILQDGSELEIAVYDYYTDSFYWVPVVFTIEEPECSYSSVIEQTPKNFHFIYNSGMHVRNYRIH